MLLCQFSDDVPKFYVSSEHNNYELRNLLLIYFIQYYTDS